MCASAFFVHYMCIDEELDVYLCAYPECGMHACMLALYFQSMHAHVTLQV